MMESFLASTGSSLVARFLVPLHNPDMNHKDLNANLTISPDQPISASAQVFKETRLS